MSDVDRVLHEADFDALLVAEALAGDREKCDWCVGLFIQLIEVDPAAGNACHLVAAALRLWRAGGYSTEQVARCWRLGTGHRGRPKAASRDYLRAFVAEGAAHPSPIWRYIVACVGFWLDLACDTTEASVIFGVDRAEGRQPRAAQANKEIAALVVYGQAKLNGRAHRDALDSAAAHFGEAVVGSPYVFSAAKLHALRDSVRKLLQRPEHADKRAAAAIVLGADARRGLWAMGVCWLA